VYVVDASVWVAYYLAADQFHDASERWIDAIVAADEAFFMPLLLRAELVSALVRRTGRPRFALRALSYVDELPQVNYEPIDEGLAAHAVAVAVERRLAGADAVYFALAEALDIPLVTWDTEPLERGAPRARRPADLA
jgi:predicted nucleic acid-binding protein